MNSIVSANLGYPMPVTSTPARSATRTVVDTIVDRTVLSANYLASGLAGGVAGVGAYARSVGGSTLQIGASTYTNVYKAQTWGPNIKVLTGLVAAPALALAMAVALPVSFARGAAQGVHDVDASKPRQLTVGAAARDGYAHTRTSWTETTHEAVHSLDDFGARPLQAGEKPFDVPVGRTAKTVAVGLTSAAEGIVTGALAAPVSAAREVAKGVEHAVLDQDLKLAGKALGVSGAVLGGVAQGASYGIASALSVLHEGVGDTWSHASLGAGLKGATQRSEDLLKAAFSPQSVLTTEEPPKPAV